MVNALIKYFNFFVDLIDGRIDFSFVANKISKSYCFRNASNASSTSHSDGDMLYLSCANESVQVSMQDNILTLLRLYSNT